MYEDLCLVCVRALLQRGNRQISGLCDQLSWTVVRNSENQEQLYRGHGPVSFSNYFAQKDVDVAFRVIANLRDTSRRNLVPESSGLR